MSRALNLRNELTQLRLGPNVYRPKADQEFASSFRSEMCKRTRCPPKDLVVAEITSGAINISLLTERKQFGLAQLNGLTHVQVCA